jgi:hypothetical protein
MNFGSILTKLSKAAKLCGLTQQSSAIGVGRSRMPGAAVHAGSSGAATGGVVRQQWWVADMTWDRVR